MTSAANTPTLLMVSGGSDSMALLEMCARDLISSGPLEVLHINHMTRNGGSDADESFVAERCRELDIAFVSYGVDVAALVSAGRAGGFEAVAREERYAKAEQTLDAFCASCGVASDEGRIFTAHTLDDRVETFFMRALVGTGPGGFSSIAKQRGRVERPLLSKTREELREILRGLRPQLPDSELWHDDPTNDDGSNFRSRVRTQLIPVARELSPGFEHTLERSMDLIAAEERDRSEEAAAIVYRNLLWDGTTARLPLSALLPLSASLKGRVIRTMLLVVNPQARLESAQIERIAAGIAESTFSTEVSGAIRVHVSENKLVAGRVSPGVCSSC